MNELFATLGFSPNQIKLTRLFLPSAFEQRASAVIGSTRFVHYTSASSAAAIFRSRAVWLRNATTMNDYSEINFGIDSVVACLHRIRLTETGRQFWELINELGDGLPKEITEAYDGWLDDLRYKTFMFCLSEHDASEDQTGRLSMWRAYGGDTGVAIVINGGALHRVSDALATYTYPVLYNDRETAETHFSNLVSGLIQEKEFLAAQPTDALAAWVHEMLRAYSLCLKHPGFKEEREWRVVHQPNVNPSSRVPHKLVDIKGHPQVVHELPLKNFPDENLFGLEPNELIDRIIIGPTKYPMALYDYCCAALAEVGVEEPHKRVFVSNIPLRT